MSPKRMLAVLIGSVVLAGIALWLQRAMGVYRAERAEFSAEVPADALPPDGRGPAELRDVSWEIEGGLSQHAWYLPPKNGALVIYLHGSPGSRTSLLPEARALAEHGYGALLLDLPGYGMSAGRRTWDASFRASTNKAIDFAISQPEVDATRLAGYGYSMGTCILVQVAASDPRLRAVILRGAFTRLDDQLRHQFRTRVPWVSELAIIAAARAGVDAKALDSEQKIAILGRRPLFLIVGAEDGATPVWMPTRLKEVAGEAELWVVPGVGHVGIAELIGAPYFDRLRAFLDRGLAEASRE